MFRTIFLFLSLVLWINSSPISDYYFPTVTPQDINNYWELKKVIYSIVMFLIITSHKQNNKVYKIISLIFLGVLFEDITDRLQGINYFEYSDIMSLKIILISSILITYKNAIYYKINALLILRCNRDEKLH